MMQTGVIDALQTKYILKKPEVLLSNFKDLFKISTSLSGLSWKWFRGCGNGKSKWHFRYPSSRTFG